jgi:hypothetical protein
VAEFQRVEPAERVASQRTIETPAKADVVDAVMEGIASDETTREPTRQRATGSNLPAGQAAEIAASGTSAVEVAPGPGAATPSAGQPDAGSTPAGETMAETAPHQAPAVAPAAETVVREGTTPLPAGPGAAEPSDRAEGSATAGQVPQGGPPAPPSAGLASDAPSATDSPAAGRNPDTGVAATRPYVPEPAVPEAVASSPEAVGKTASPGETTTNAGDLAVKPAEAVAKFDEAAAKPGPSTGATAQPAGRSAKHGEPVWPDPAALLADLEGLTKHEMAYPWAKETVRLLANLGPAMCKGSPEAGTILDSLEVLGGKASIEVSHLQDHAVARQWGQAVHGLQRRLAIWKQINRMGGLAAADAQAPAADSQSMVECLKEIESLTRDSEQGDAWRKYLLLDALRDWAGGKKSPQEPLPGDLAQQLLRRLNQPQVTPHQRQFLSSGPLVALHKEIVRHASGPVDATRLLEDLEHYERSGLPSDAHILAQDCQYLAAGSNEAYRQAAARLEQHYRNANLRLAISAELLNRMVPKRTSEYAKVEETVLGIPVRGQSLIATELAIRMVPDPARVHVALQVSGEVSSSTSSTSGPATFVTDSEAMYVARKPMVIDLRGITLWPTQVDVDQDSRLRHVRTRFEPVPLVGLFARDMARSEYERQRPAADAEAQQKLAARVQERVDREATAQLTDFGHRLHEQLLGPIETMLLDPTLVAAETTPQRAIMRVRLAGHDQLGSHTPRPQAPADSLFSAQIHESLLNNILDRLDLEGQTFTPAELETRIADRLRHAPPQPSEAEQEDVKITFAAQNAVRVRCAQGRIEVTLAVAKLTKASRRWKDFQVRAYYRPDIHGRSIELLRDGVVQLMGSKIPTGSQLALRGVFSKVFSQKSPWEITPKAVTANPNLQGLTFTQFTLDDGWLAVALGPERTAARPGLLRR